ncbi:hypothetical protein C5167_050549 [Papaver somniferum]|uniref:Uncharacterized protein n=1 Tax=Papaver somniferum TaxID=3469 RepID=A0A4Y7KRS8_PAPSO|nr:hypothetical protein C5167_050549 [Papaver somniferum]
MSVQVCMSHLSALKYDSVVWGFRSPRKRREHNSVEGGQGERRSENQGHQQLHHHPQLIFHYTILRLLCNRCVGRID